MHTDATNELKTSVSDGKTAIAAAVTDKGVNTAASDSFSTMATNIGSIPTGTDTSDATATAAQILSGKIAYVKGSKVTGTMTNQGAKTSSLNCGGSYTIPAGYHNGSGKITANSLASQTSATATAANIAKGKTAWVNGSKITGTLVSASQYTFTSTITFKSYYGHSISVSMGDQTYNISGFSMEIISATGDYADGVSLSSAKVVRYYDVSTSTVTFSLSNNKITYSTSPGRSSPGGGNQYMTYVTVKFTCNL